MQAIRGLQKLSGRVRVREGSFWSSGISGGQKLQGIPIDLCCAGMGFARNHTWKPPADSAQLLLKLTSHTLASSIGLLSLIPEDLLADTEQDLCGQRMCGKYLQAATLQSEGQREKGGGGGGANRWPGSGLVGSVSVTAITALTTPIKLTLWPGKDTTRNLTYSTSAKGHQDTSHGAVCTIERLEIPWRPASSWLVKPVRMHSRNRIPGVHQKRWWGSSPWHTVPSPRHIVERVKQTRWMQCTAICAKSLEVCEN